jgi:hypothetical protein
MPKNRLQNKKRPLSPGKSSFRGSGSTIAISKLLARDSTLHNIGAIASAQQQWLAWMREQLPEALAPRLIQVIIKGGELIGYAESATWCERLRYAAEPLLAKASERDPSIGRIRVRVSPGSGAAPRKG